LLTIDSTFHDTDVQPGFSFAELQLPQGCTGIGMPHGAVITRWHAMCDCGARTRSTRPVSKDDPLPPFATGRHPAGHRKSRGAAKGLPRLIPEDLAQESGGPGRAAISLK
jgi:hypothetical protein